MRQNYGSPHKFFIVFLLIVLVIEAGIDIYIKFVYEAIQPCHATLWNQITGGVTTCGGHIVSIDALGIPWLNLAIYIEIAFDLLIIVLFLIFSNSSKGGRMLK